MRKKENGKWSLETETEKKKRRETMVAKGHRESGPSTGVGWQKKETKELTVGSSKCEKKGTTGGRKEP